MVPQVKVAEDGSLIIDEERSAALSLNILFIFSHHKKKTGNDVSVYFYVHACICMCVFVAVAKYFRNPWNNFNESLE